MALGNDGRSEVILRRLMLVCIAITAIISGIAIVGWMLDWLILAGISTNYIPMAQSTALLFILLSGALLVYIRQPASFHFRMLAWVGVFLILLISLIILIEFFTGMTIDIEQLLVSRPDKIEGVPIGRMSPITAANFLLAGSALLLLLTSPATGKQRARGAAAFLATLIISVGFVVLLGYLYGTPFLYGGKIIPVALTTAIVFVFLGIGIMLAAGEHYWPLGSFMGSSVSARLLRVFFPLTIVLVLMVTFLDVVIFRNVSNHVLFSSVVTILSMIILGIILPRISHVIGSDIDRANAEKERAINALRKSEEQFQSVAQTANDAIITSDSRGTIVFWNHGAERIFGYSAEEMAGKPITFIMPERHREPHKNAMSRVVTTGKSSIIGKTVELSGLGKDGNEFPIELSLSSWKTKEDIFFSGIVRDITQRKQTEEELKKYDEHLEKIVKERTHELSLSREKEHAAALYARNLIETSLDPLVTIKKDGTILDVNKATELVTGFSRDKLIGSDFSGYFTEPEKAKEGYNLVFIQGFVRDYPLAIHHTSGKITYVLYNASVYRNEDGEIQGVFAAARDISERKRGEEFTKLEDRRLQSLLKISMHKPETQNDLLNMALDEVVSLSDSKIGYIYYYSEEKEEFTLHAWSKNVMESCTIQEPQTTYLLRLTGIWGEAIRQRKPIIVNDFQMPNPLKKGYPVGHNPLFRFMTLPVFINERIVAVVGVGNKETDYNDI